MGVFFFFFFWLVIVDHLNATTRAAYDLPGYRLHPLKGGLRGFWSAGGVVA
jgi:hypothetical protein